MKMNKTLLVILLIGLGGHAFAEDITVSAAASLKDAFNEIARTYQQQFPQDTVKLNTAASGVLLQQVVQGAPVDVVAFADEATMDKAMNQNLIEQGSRHRFATNSLVLIQPQNHSVVLKSIADLRKSMINRIAIGKPETVPAGSYAQTALQKAKLFDILKPKYVFTQNVRQALDYAARGEVDAAFVYKTDALLQKDKLHIVGVVPVSPVISYPLAVVKSSAHKQSAQNFNHYVLSEKGQQILQKYGFTKP